MMKTFLLFLTCSHQLWTMIRAQVPCPRFPDGSDYIQPYNVHSSKGYLEVDLTYESRFDDNGLPLFCFMMRDGVNQSPALHVYPGDTILFTVYNNYPGTNATNLDEKEEMEMSKVGNKVPCGAMYMTSSSVNVHFHGIHGAPQCHQDEVIETLINYKETFTYQITVPFDQQPGLYWYHTHIMTLSEESLLGGASGAIIVKGIANKHKGLAGLPEQIMVFRDHGVLDNVTALYPNINGSIYDLSLNYITISLPESIPPVLRIQPSEKQLWRIVNAGADAILLLKLQYDNIAIPFDVIAVDGDIVTSMYSMTEILLPPGKRVQIVIVGPSLSVQRAVLTTQYVWTGNDGDLDPTRDLLLLIPDVNATDSEFILPLNLTTADQDDLTDSKFAINMVKDLMSEPVDQVRVLYFSELPDNETFYITEVGKPLIAYSQDVAPALTSYTGTVEKWVIQNRAEEMHVFHIHQIHFLAVAIDGVPLAQPVFRDVLEIPTWSGRESDPYPNMTILVDFRSPLIVGLFPYHCHILSHEDHGMMATIQVLPGKLAVPKTTPAPTSIISLFVASSQSSPYTVSDPVVIGLICVSLFACVLLLIIFGLLYSSKRSNKKSFDSDVKASIDIEMDDENCNSTPDLVIQSEATNTPDPFPSALGSPIIDYSTYNEQNDQWSNEKP